MANEKVKKPIYKRWWAWLIAVIVVIGIAAAASGGGNNAQPTSAKDSGSSGKSTNNSSGKSTNNSSGKSTNKPNNNKKTAKIGQAVTIGKFSVTVNKISYQDKLNDDGTNMAPSANGGRWLIVNVTITNNDSKARTLDTSMFTLLDGSTKYDASAEADPWINNNDSFFLKDLNPGLKATGNLAFNVPKEGSFQLKVDSGVLFANTGSVTIDLKK